MMFDWLETYDTIKPFIEDAIIGKNAKVLILGCGNAEFSENMYDAGYHDIENIDISSVVIDQMSDRNWNRPEMQYKIMDVRDLQYPDNYFDMLIDKSTIDALLCGENSFVNVAKMMKEV
jgi:ubiquinone/menaquinone biosynthesis C-methylase UbiE